MSLMEETKAKFRALKSLDLDEDLLEAILVHKLAIAGKKTMTRITEDFVRTQFRNIDNVKALLSEIENGKLQGNDQKAKTTTGKPKAASSKKSSKNKDSKRSVDMVSTESSDGNVERKGE